MTWASARATVDLEINDKNWRQFAPKNPRTLIDGQGRGYVPRDYDREPLGTYAEEFDASLLIPREEMFDRCEELERKKIRLSDFALAEGVDRKSQGNTNYCWMNAPAWAAELTLVMQGQPYIELSPASGAAKIKNFRNQGGWGDQACDWIAKHGLVPAKLWPVNAIQRKYDTDKAWTAADRYVMTEWNEMPSRVIDYAFSCYLREIPVPVGFNWWRHLVCGCDLIANRKPRANAQGKISDRELLSAFSTRIANSWGHRWGNQGFGILSGTRQVPDGQCAVHSMRRTTRSRRK